MVLCDSSILNPNVFFEMGVRTSLDKPMCHVADKHIEKLPFDTNIVNHHPYDPDLSVWIVKEEIKKLAEHIAESARTSEGKNTIWQAFGINTVSQGLPESTSQDDKLAYLIKAVGELSKKVERAGEMADLRPVLPETPVMSYSHLLPKKRFSGATGGILRDVVRDAMEAQGVRLPYDIDANEASITMVCPNDIPDSVANGIAKEIHKIAPYVLVRIERGDKKPDDK
ncbi:MAG: hypothetical protein BIFFINMI_03584 [Phycisphaerae bacterium]|nr:hypothetical protein [Phycisphaerae bacterium]